MSVPNNVSFSTKIRILFWRVYYLVVNPFRALYWCMVHPQKRGSKCLVEHDGKVLLVRLAYGSKKWSVPGGTVNKQESFEEAAKRELKEETNIDIHTLQEITTYEVKLYCQRYTIKCFIAQTDNQDATVDLVEIAESRWVFLHELPQPREKQVDRIIASAQASRLLPHAQAKQ